MKLNFKIIFYFFGILLLFNGSFMFLSSILSFLYNDGITLSLILSGVIVSFLGLLSMLLTKKHSKEMNKILIFMRNVIDDKSFNNSLIDKYSKIKRYNTNLLMWNHIQDDQ